MPIQPIQPIPDLNLTGAITGALNSVPPSSSGDGSRWNAVRTNRPAQSTRNLVRWFVPETGIVDMYVNPENITQTDSKLITNTRTRGGYVLQYWGEELKALKISGTTASSGIEGINVLEDIYRSEQISFDPYALSFAAYQDQTQGNQTLVGDLPNNPFDILGTGLGQSFAAQITNSLEYGTANPTRPRPTLASLAFSVEMYWSGWTFRGYFKDFSVVESINKLGIFDYNMTFMCTQRRGYRTNFLGWHRSPTSGASNSDPISGVPYSYGSLQSSQGFQAGRQVQENVISTNNKLLSSTGYIRR